jgi:transposase-like protein
MFPLLNKNVVGSFFVLLFSDVGMFIPGVLRFLSSEGECVASLRRARWPGVVICPICGSREVIRWCRYRDYQRYMCKVCRKTFNDRTGTIFHYSRLSLRAWLLLIILSILTHTSIRFISRLLDTSYMTVFRASKRLLHSLDKPIAELQGEVEIDEVYQTAGLKGRNNSILIKLLGRRPRRRGLKRRGRVTYREDKVPVLASIERGGRRLFATSGDVTEETILALAKPRIKPGSMVYTDNFTSYNILSNLYRHEAVNHSIGEYARGEAHVNTCEGEFSIFRPFISIHRGVAKYNMPLYVSLYQLHRETRQMEVIQALEYIIKTILPLLLQRILAKTLITHYQQHSYLRAYVSLLKGKEGGGVGCPPVQHLGNPRGGRTLNYISQHPIVG